MVNNSVSNRKVGKEPIICVFVNSFIHLRTNEIKLSFRSCFVLITGEFRQTRIHLLECTGVGLTGSCPPGRKPDAEEMARL